MVLLNQVFPCFHCFGKTTPSHMLRLLHKFFFRGRREWNVNQLSHVPVIYCSIFCRKKHPNLEKKRLIFSKQCVKSFLM